MTIEQVAELIFQGAVGTTIDPFQVIDELIDAGDFSQEFFNENEISILNILDDQMFTCECCGWNYWISEVSDEEDGVCNDCAS